MDKQKMIVAATMCLHNFIRENNALDRHFRKCDEDPDYVPTIPQRYKKYAPCQMLLISQQRMQMIEIWMSFEMI